MSPKTPNKCELNAARPAQCGTRRCKAPISALRSARFPFNMIGSPMNHANRLIGSPITSQSTDHMCAKQPLFCASIIVKREDS